MGLRIQIVGAGELSPGDRGVLDAEAGTALQASPESGTAPAELVLFEAGRLGERPVEKFLRFRSGFADSLLCMLTPFARRSLEEHLLAAGLWAVLYQPLRAEDVRDLLARARALIERRGDGARAAAILVVDDEATFRETYRSLLGGAGHRVDLAKDGDEGLRLFASREYDLVVTDLQMPGLDGVELLAHIRESGSRVPVVLSTGHGTVDAAVAALRTGATDFVRKPFRAASFLAVVERALRIGRLLRENLALENQARDEQLLLRRRQYALRVLAESGAAMARATGAEAVAERWLGAVAQIVDHAHLGILLAGDEPSLMVLGGEPPGGDAALLERARRLRPGLFPEGGAPTAVRRLSAAGPRCTAAEEAAEPWSLPLGTPDRSLGAVLVWPCAGGSVSEEEEAFLRSITGQAAQVIETLRAREQRERSRQEAMVAGMHQGVVLADPEGRIHVLNEAARDLLGLREASSDLAGLAGATGLPIDRWFQELVSGGRGTLSREHHQREPIERALAVDLSAVPDDSGEAAAVVALIRDVTELREVDRLKTEFVAIVSHELRTPLAALKNCIGIMLKRYAGEVTPAQERFLRMGDASIDRMTKIVGDLLDIARIESGQLRLDSGEVDMADLLREAAAEAEPLLAEQGLSLEVEQPEESVLVAGDRDRLKQVLLNLLQNAGKFSREGGRVTGRVLPTRRGENLPPEVRRLLAPGPERLVEVQVADEGIGISPEDRERIFDRFHQVEQSLRREQGGIGLGLPISRGIVRSHGGEIWAEGRKGRGSVFRVVLPAAAGTGEPVR